MTSSAASILAAIVNTIFQPGFFENEPVYTALVVGGGAAIVSAIVGVFTVMRGQSFAGHALSDVSSAGGAASFLLGINPLIGFLTMGLLAAGAMEMVHVRNVRERDLVTGIVMGAGLGLAALLLYFDVTSHSTTGAAITVMFGSMFAIPEAIIPLALLVGLGALLLVTVIYRPLLLSSIDPELAAVRGIPVRFVSLLHLLMLAMAVALSAIAVGAILSTALLIGPPAIALRLVKRPGQAIVTAVVIGVGSTWAAILLAYDSYYWTPGHGWPVSFFVVTLILIFYIFASGARRGKKAKQAAHTPTPTKSMSSSSGLRGDASNGV
ncbi:metal ABC transporter permease [Caballeronia sordidicola]|uniref:Zinc ABC transporter, inner membrane permease protein ZnuB n=1 Tax=Caballeronia sordidicola TaxID=196367 RepID=A0A226X3P3_CABSO|nr:metal ABC transporter permease [Caballeronia sordidicola]OXC78054.1 Zinc ABC transporter, inner membrane permease protein ZnuB [Caballeronia sordidicola]